MTDNTTPSSELHLSRRGLLGWAGAAAAIGMTSPARAVTEEQLFPIVETSNGKLRGISSYGTHIFKGVHYGADTGGANRFMPPQPVAKWAGVKDALNYGSYAPQLPTGRGNAYADLILYDIQPGGMGEDCLVANIWTPSLSATAKKPVLVHLHGGGFYAGSGNSPQFDGHMLSRFGDAVVVTLNHRLGSFGFLNLADAGGERYAKSGTVGMLDIVAALAWIKENIAAFGGDPSRVLVFGQSGGGLKTSALMAMPSAKGLFHRAGVMSGSGIRIITADQSATIADSYLKLLGLGKASVGQLHTLPFSRLLAAQVTMEAADRQKGEAPRAFSPVLDGVEIPRHPFDPDAPAVSADVPMIVGTVLDERAYRRTNFDLDEAGLLAFANEVGYNNGKKLVEMYRAEDPTASAYILQSRLDTDTNFRRGAHIQIDRKAAQGAASVYSYLWKIPSPAYGGRFGAPHGVDIGPSLYDIRNGLNGPTTEQVRLAEQMASAWVAFAATGNPNNAKTPRWDAFTVPQRATLVFEGDSSKTATVNDPRKAFREQWGG
ncbi:MAG: hypothetical protein RLZZ618_588 [Pseudomonadota bacterium]|jgi:para-nitrobenzyl esterase